MNCSCMAIIPLVRAGLAGEVVLFCSLSNLTSLVFKGATLRRIWKCFLSYLHKTRFLLFALGILSSTQAKFGLLLSSLKKQPFRSSFNLNGSVLEEVYEFRDLGLLTNHHLSWNSHVDAITNKANRILGLLRRTCRGWKGNETLKVLYCTLVRSQVEYG